MAGHLNPEPRNAAFRQAILSAPMHLGVERAILWSQGERLAGDAPAPIRNALAFEHLCNNLRLIILDHELIAGNKTEHLLGYPWFAERGDVNWILTTEMAALGSRRTDRLVIGEEDRRQVKRLLKQYRGRTSLSRVIRALREEGILGGPRSLGSAALGRMVKGLGVRGTAAMIRRWVYPALRSPAMATALFRTPEYVALVLNASCGLLGFQGHVVFGHNRVLEKGFDGIAARAGAASALLAASDPNHDEKRDFYEAVGICCRAARTYGNRLAKHAEDLACSAPSGARKAELVEMAAALRRVAGGPASSFREAVQLMWLSKLLLELYHPVSTISLGRIDRMLAPYYSADLACGKITPEQARGLLEELFLKIWTCTLYLGPGVQELSSQRFTGYQALTVGGTDEDGRDVTSDLTYLCIDALDSVRPIINLCVRLHPGSPPRLVERVVEAISNGASLAVYNDRVYAKALERLGVKPEHARDYAVIGCVEQVSASRTGGNTGSSQLNLAALVDMAIRNGSPGMPMAALLTGGNGLVQREFRLPSSFDELMAAFERQLDHAVDRITRGVGIIDREYMKHPTPFISMTIDGCLESGRDITCGGAMYDVSAITLTGMANAADSLMAIKRAVFDEKWITLERLVEALDRNFRGDEALRQRIMNRIPKFGNDDDEVDGIARRVMQMTFEKIRSRRNIRGGPFSPAYVSLALHILFGQALGATPDGRLAGTPICNSLSPVNGMDRRGPTAVLNSVSKIDATCFSSGVAVNIRLHPHGLQRPEGRRKLSDLILAYFDKGGPQLQITVADAETLKDARRHPERYPSLMVKVGGYSALFSDLGPDIQDDVIARAPHGL